MTNITAKIILISFILILPFSSFAQINDDIYIHGFISQGYIQSDKNNYLADTEKGTFQFNEVGINFVNQPLRNLKIGAQLFARDLGAMDNDTVTIDWAFADYRFADYFGIRAGRIKNPFGLYNETRDLDMLKTCILLPSSVYAEEYRDTFLAINGMGVYGEIMMERAGYFSYYFLAGSTNASAEGGSATSYGGSSFDLENLNIKDIYNTSLQWGDPSGHIKLGGSLGAILEVEVDAVTTEYALNIIGLPSGLETDIITEDTFAWVLSAEFTINSFVFSAEYKRLSSESTVSFPSLPMDVSYDSDIEEEGYYGLVSYRINSLIEIGTYYSVYYPNYKDKNGDRFAARQGDRFEAWRKDAALSTRFDLNRNWLLKLEWHYIDGVAPILDKMNPDGIDRYWNLFLAKVSYVF